MGVAKFYRWLSERYPQINQRIGKDTQFLPVFDNMYLDMNGIIHTCTHPNDEEISDAMSMKDMVLGMFSYVDHMVQIVKPQKVLVLAVDGCAPRAKMNQQRSRRFASAKDRKAMTDLAIIKGEMSEADVKNQFDSNCITPGTEFMAQVSKHFQYFIRKKIKEDPLWRKLKVVYSGHDIPGEGEHKIMDYIRHNRMQPGYDPNTRHCLCGLDADLIMLGLASHEPHFALLREQIDFNAFRKNKNGTKEVKKQINQDKWQLLHLSTLRQYLDLEFRTDSLPFEYSLERIVDDWVLMVMLVGNDFLPHLPSLDIGEGALNDMTQLYRELLPEMGGYITEDGVLNFDRLEMLLKALGEKEDQVFVNRERERKKFEKRNNRQQRGRKAPVEVKPVIKAITTTPTTSLFVLDSDDDSDADSDSNENESSKANQSNAPKTFKENYYMEKFGVSHDEDEIHTALRSSYINGLQWCYLYYYQGVQSWTWFYPFHYAPMASDLVNCSSYEIHLPKGKPFPPFMQLLGCLPAASSWCLPACYRALMQNDSSPIKEFYPDDFQVDMNGKRNPWEGVNLLPFIDSKKLYAAVEEYCKDEMLTADERKRNSFGVDLIFQFDTENITTIPSTFPSAGLSDITCCQSSCKEYKLPYMKRFLPELLPGCITNRAYPGDPNLLALALSKKTGLKKCALNIFGRETGKEVFVLRLQYVDALEKNLVVTDSEGSDSEDDVTPTDDEENLLEIVNTISKKPKTSGVHQEKPIVYVNYPMLHDAQVIAIASMNTIYEFQSYNKKTKEWRYTSRRQTKDERDCFLRDGATAQSRMLIGSRTVGSGGLDIGKVKMMFLVRPLNGISVDLATGAQTQQFSADETWIPYQVVGLENDAPDERFIATASIPLTTRLPINSMIMCLGKAGYGQVGTVVGHDVESNSVKAKFNASTNLGPPFGHTIAASIVDKYISTSQAAKYVGLSASVLGKVMGSIRVAPGRHDIGLNLKIGKEYMIPGYARSRTASNSTTAWTSNESVVVVGGLDAVTVDTNMAASGSAQWEYTIKALEIAKKYKQKFPKVFKLLNRKPDEREYSISEMFGPGDAGHEEIETVIKWLHQLDTYKLPLVPTTSKVMSRDAIVAVQRAAAEINANLAKKQSKDKYVTVTLPSDLVFKCANDSFGWINSPSKDVQPILGDRITNLGSPVVPFGLCGTVVATHASTGCIEVLFDSDFVGGTSLYGACKPGRGKLLPWAQVLNISRRSPLKSKQKGQKGAKEETTKSAPKEKAIKNKAVEKTVKILKRPDKSPIITDKTSKQVGAPAVIIQQNAAKVQRVSKKNIRPGSVANITSLMGAGALLAKMPVPQKVPITIAKPRVEEEPLPLEKLRPQDLLFEEQLNIGSTSAVTSSAKDDAAGLNDYWHQLQSTNKRRARKTTTSTKAASADATVTASSSRANRRKREADRKAEMEKLLQATVSAPKAAPVAEEPIEPKEPRKPAPVVKQAAPQPVVDAKVKSMMEKRNRLDNVFRKAVVAEKREDLFTHMQQQQPNLFTPAQQQQQQQQQQYSMYPPQMYGQQQVYGQPLPYGQPMYAYPPVTQQQPQLFKPPNGN